MTEGTDNPHTGRSASDGFAGYGQPEDVLADPALTQGQKADILMRWEYDAAEHAVALEEGMPGGNGEELQRVLTALRALTGSIDVEHTGPSKQHPLYRPTVRHND